MNFKIKNWVGALFLVWGVHSAATQEIMSRNHPSLSPKGDKMVYHVQNQEQRTILYIANVDGSEERKLYEAEGTNAQEPRWSPDGKWIAFVSGDYQPGDSGLGVYLIKPDGSEKRFLYKPEKGVAKSPHWKKDSKTILFAERHREEGWAKIHTMNIDGSDHQVLDTQGEGFHYQPRWGQKSDRILVTWWSHEKQNEGDFYIFDTKKPENKNWVTRTKLLEGMPAWSPDEKYLVFYKFVNNNSELFVLNMKTKKEFQLTNTEGASEFFPSFSRDGKMLIYQSYEANPEKEGEFTSVIKTMPFNAKAFKK